MSSFEQQGQRGQVELKGPELKGPGTICLDIVPGTFQPEYIVAHELVHILERTHNSRFKALMDQFMPRWRFYRDELNRLPVHHERWRY